MRRLGKKLIVVVLISSTMPPGSVVTSDVGTKFADESTSSESLDQPNSLDILEEENGEQRIALRKNVSLIIGMYLAINTVISASVFVSPTTILKETNSNGTSLLIWLACGWLALFRRLCFAELETCIKNFGGEYSYLMEAFGRIPAFLFVWASVLILQPASGAIIALTLAKSITQPFYSASETPAPIHFTKLMACSCLGKT